MPTVDQLREQYTLFNLISEQDLTAMIHFNGTVTELCDHHWFNAFMEALFNTHGRSLSVDAGTQCITGLNWNCRNDCSIELLEPVATRDKLIWVWLDELRQEVPRTMKAAFHAAWRRHAGSKCGDMLEIPRQAAQLVLRVRFNAAVEKALGLDSEQPKPTLSRFRATEDAVAALETLKEEMQQDINESVALFATDLKPSQRDRMKAHVTQNNALLLMLTKLIEALKSDPSTNAAEDFWQTMLRTALLPNGKVVVRCGSGEAPQRFDTCGEEGLLVQTPLTWAAYNAAFTECFAGQRSGLVAAAGPAGTGKTETMKDLAKMVGVPCFVINCSDRITLSGAFSHASPKGHSRAQLSTASPYAATLMPYSREPCASRHRRHHQTGRRRHQGWRPVARL